MLNRLIYIVLFFSISFFSCNQTPTQKTKNSPDQGRNNVQHDTSLIDQFNQASFEAQKNNYKDIIRFAQKAKILAHKIQDSMRLARANYNLASGYHLTGNQDSAYLFCQQALQSMSHSNDSIRINMMLDLLATILTAQNKVFEAINIYLDVLESNKRLKDTSGIASTYLNIAVAYYYIYQDNKAANYYDKAIKLFIELKDSFNLALCYDNKGLLFNMKDYLSYAPQALKLYKQMNNLDGIANINNNIGAYYLSKNLIKKSIPFSIKALNIWQKIGDKPNISNVCNALAHAYLKLDNHEKANEYIQIALTLALASKDLEEIKEIHKTFSEIHENTGKYKEAFYHLKKTATLTDSIINMQRVESILKISEQYQSAQKDQQLAEQDLTLAQQRNTILMISIGGVSLLLLLIAFFQSYTYRQRLKKQATEQQLLIQKAEAKRLEDLHQMKSTFLANISHELRTPLTLLLSPLQSILDGDLKGDQTKYLQLMAKNGIRLEGLINQLLNISRLEKKEWPAQEQSVDLWTQLRFLTNSFDSYAINKNIFFEITIPNDSLHVLIDVEKLEQIILNLLSNAFKYTKEKGTVFFDAALENQQLHVTVKDTGKGIPPKDLPHVFDRFFRVEGQTEGPQAGSGIGLALVKDLVNWFQGSIQVQSKINKGSLFSVTIPLKAQHTSVQNTVAQKPTPTPKTASLDEKSVILIVEDHPDVRKLLAEQLEGIFNILQASNGLEGLQKATELVPDLIITDVMMPQMNGRAFCKQLKEQVETSHIPVIMLTALSQKKEKLKGLAVAADYYLTKPFHVKEIKLIIRNLLDLRTKIGKHLKEKGVLAIAKTTLPSIEKAFLDQLINIIEQNLDQENYTVNQLATDIGLSRSQLHRKLVALTNQTPSQFMRKLKLQHAKQMLMDNTGTISEVAFACGFSSLSYFSRCFTEQFGHPPSQTIKL